MLPTKIFFTKGVGASTEYLASFELALRSAGIAQYNLVSVSSIYPPGVKRVSREEGIKMLPAGSIVHAVIARNATDEPNRLISASIGVAVPNDPNQFGYLSEHHPFGETAEKTGERAEDLAATMLASAIGIEFNRKPVQNIEEKSRDHNHIATSSLAHFDTSWKEKVELIKSSGQIARTTNITQSALGNKDGL